MGKLYACVCVCVCVCVLSVVVLFVYLFVFAVNKGIYKIISSVFFSPHVVSLHCVLCFLFSVVGVNEGVRIPVVYCVVVAVFSVVGVNEGVPMHVVCCVVVFFSFCYEQPDSAVTTYRNIKCRHDGVCTVQQKAVPAWL